jgi:hypothetical protein
MLVNILLCAVVYLGFAVWELDKRILRLQGQIDPAFGRARKTKIRDGKRNWFYASTALTLLAWYGAEQLFGFWFVLGPFLLIFIALMFWGLRIERREEDRFLETYHHPSE